VGVPYGSNPATCPVRAYEAWIEAAGAHRGQVFMPVERHGNIGDARITDRGVALVIKRRVELADLDASEVSGHSLRRGTGDGCCECGRSGACDSADDGAREHDGTAAVHQGGIAVQRERRLGSGVVES
jgi:hypothetical protein